MATITSGADPVGMLYDGSGNNLATEATASDAQKQAAKHQKQADGSIRLYQRPGTLITDKADKTEAVEQFGTYADEATALAALATASATNRDQVVIDGEVYRYDGVGSLQVDPEFAGSVTAATQDAFVLKEAQYNSGRKVLKTDDVPKTTWIPTPAVDYATWSGLPTFGGKFEQVGGGTPVATQHAITVDATAALGTTHVIFPGTSVDEGESIRVHVTPAGGQTTSLATDVGTANQIGTTDVWEVGPITAATTITLTNNAVIVVPPALDAGIAHQLNFDYSGANNKPFTFSPAVDVTVDGKDLDATRTYLAKYTADATSDAADITNDYANLTILGDANDVPSDRNIDVAVNTAFTAATDFPEQNVLYLVKASAGADLTADATIEVDGTTVTPYTMVAGDEALAVYDGTTLRFYPFSKSAGLNTDPDFTQGPIEATDRQTIFNEIVRQFGTLFDRLGIAFDAADLGDRQGADFDNVASVTAMFDLLITRIENLRDGKPLGSGATFASRPVAPADADATTIYQWILQTEDVGANEKPGVFLTDAAGDWYRARTYNDLIAVDETWFVGGTTEQETTAALWTIRNVLKLIELMGDPIFLTGTNEELQDRRFHIGGTANKPAKTLTTGNAKFYAPYFNTDTLVISYYVADPADDTKLIVSAAPQSSGLEIVRYTADGAIEDKDHRAIFETGAVNMTLAASTTDRLIQMVSEGPTTVITANGAEEFTSGTGTSTDQKLTINETFKWATIIGRTAGGWSQYVGQVGLPAGVDESTPTKFKAGTRLVQNGVNVGSGTVTFPEAFKAGTTPTVMILPFAPGDNTNVTLQSVSETGFNAWIVRNESDVGQTKDIHWIAIGEIA